MTDLKQETLKILKENHIRPKKYLSQNFVVNSSLNNKHVEILDLQPEDTVIEIGPGLGFLTEVIAKRVNKVVAIEIDREMTEFLERRLNNYSNVVVLLGNILKTEDSIFKNAKIVSNTPYSISSPLLFKILEAKNYKVASLTFQKEFAERLIAEPKTSKYGKISLTSRLYGTIELIDQFPKEYFFPEPKVDSAIVKISPREWSDIKDLGFLQLFIKEIFNYRNKKLRNGIKYFLKRKKRTLDYDVLEENTKLFLERKIKTLSVEDLIQIIDDIKTKSQ